MSAEYKHVYKILPDQPPSPLPDALPLSDLDKNDGYIHLSTYKQVPETAGRFFTDAKELWLLKLNLSTFPPYAEAKPDNVKIGRIVWEQAGSHGVFPHLYDGDLGADVVLQVLHFQRGGEQTWEFVLGNLES